VPLIRKAVVIDPEWCAEGLSTVCAADEHHVGGRSPGWQHAAHHVDVVVSHPAGAVNRKEDLAGQTFGINRTRIQQAATKGNSCVSIKCGCLASDLCVARTHAAKSCASSPTTDKNVAVGVYINGSVDR